jgi:hypothetical protein
MIGSSALLLFKSSGTSTHLIKRLIKLDYSRYPLSLPIIWMVLAPLLASFCTRYYNDTFKYSKNL